MSKSLYTVCGVSTNEGVTKVRYANSMKRAKHLERVGHTGVALVEMPFEGSTEDAVHHLLGLEAFNTLPCVLEAAKEMGFLGYGEVKEPAEEVVPA